MATVKKTRKKKPSAAQLRARKKFVAMVRARAKAAKAKKKAAKKVTAKRKPAVKRAVKRAVSKKPAVKITVKNPLSVDQAIALRRFAKANGRNWKSELRYLWETGAYNRAVLGGAEPALLQQVRNSLGPAWLKNYKVSKPNPRRGTRKIAGQARRFSEYAKKHPGSRQVVLEARSKDKKFGLKALRGKRQFLKMNGGATLARKRRQEFVGRPSRKTLSMYAPRGSGASGTVVAMGKLKKLHIKGRTPLDFKGSALLAHNPKTDQMYILGKGYTLKHLRKNPSSAGLENLGEVTRIEYEATKTHLGDKSPVTYYHKLGEEGGKLPNALINEEGLLILEGGDYYIRPEGIRN